MHACFVGEVLLLGALRYLAHFVCNSHSLLGARCFLAKMTRQNDSTISLDNKRIALIKRTVRKGLEVSSSWLSANSGVAKLEHTGTHTPATRDCATPDQLCLLNIDADCQSQIERLIVIILENWTS